MSHYLLSVMKHFLTSTEVFQGLTDAEYFLLEKNAEAFSFHKNDRIFEKGEKVQKLYVLHHGKVKLFDERKAIQREEIIRLAGSNEVFDLAALYSKDSVHTLSAQALEDCGGFSFTEDFIKKFLQQSHTFPLAVVVWLANNSLGLIEDMSNLSLSSTKERLAKFLLKELELQKHPASFHLPLNQTQLASHLGTVREIVSRDLAALKKCHVIDSKQGEISVLNEEELEKIANGFSFKESALEK